MLCEFRASLHPQIFYKRIKLRGLPITIDIRKNNVSVVGKSAISSMEMSRNVNICQLRLIITRRRTLQFWEEIVDKIIDESPDESSEYSTKL